MSQEKKAEAGGGAPTRQTGGESIGAMPDNNGLKQPPPFDPTANGRAGSGPPVHDESQMDHPRGPLNEKFKFFLANLPPSVTPLEMRRHFEAYGNVNFVKLIYNKATGVSMGYGFLYLMDEDTDRRVDEYSVRNNYRIRFANFSRIYLQRNDKTRTRPMRGDGKPMGGGHPRHPQHMGPGHPHDRPARPYPHPIGDRKPQRGKEELPPLHRLATNEPRLRHGIPGPAPPLPRVERHEPWNRYPADRVQPEVPAPSPPVSRAYESGYYEQDPASAGYYDDQQHYAAAHDHHSGGYEHYQQGNSRDAGYQQYYEGGGEYHQQGYHGDGQQAHPGYGDQEQGYWHDDGQTGFYDAGQYNETAAYQQGEYYEGNHSSEAYAYSQQHGVARQAENYGHSQNRPYSADPSYQRESVGHSHQGNYTDANYSYPQEGSHLQHNHTDPSTAGHRPYHQNSGFRGGARGVYSHGGRGRGGGGVNSQRFQRRDRPY